MDDPTSDFVNDASIDSDFHACYLIQTENMRVKNSTYIGYCVDPARRIKQHNSGAFFGGARKTNYRGPWKMIALVYSFPNPIAALKFEWAWQHPEETPSLRHIQTKKQNEPEIEYKLNILAALLSCDTFKRLSLSIKFNSEENYTLFHQKALNLPSHIEYTMGKFESAKSENNKNTHLPNTNCVKCENIFLVNEKRLTCTNSVCSKSYHIICAYQIVQNDIINSDYLDLIPVYMKCTKCGTKMLWQKCIINCNRT